MNKTFLILGIACASLLAAAQSDARQDQQGQASGVTSPRDQATGQASGKRMHKPLTVLADDSAQVGAQDVTTAREASSGMATGKVAAQSPTGTHHDTAVQASGKAAVGGAKPMASDDWNAQQKNSMSGAQSNPMYKDNTNSGSNPLYQGKDRVAAGDVNGDGVATRITKSRSNIQNNRVAAGDVNGDGTADAAVSGNGQAQVTAERGNQPDHKASSDASAGKGASDKKTAPRDAATGQASGKRQ
jgi:hypothetical protein